MSTPKQKQKSIIKKEKTTENIINPIYEDLFGPENDFDSSPDILQYYPKNNNNNSITNLSKITEKADLEDWQNQTNTLFYDGKSSLLKQFGSYGTKESEKQIKIKKQAEINKRKIKYNGNSPKSNKNTINQNKMNHKSNDMSPTGNIKQINYSNIYSPLKSQKNSPILCKPMKEYQDLAKKLESSTNMDSPLKRQVKKEIIKNQTIQTIYPLYIEQQKLQKLSKLEKKSHSVDKHSNSLFESLQFQNQQNSPTQDTNIYIQQQLQQQQEQKQQEIQKKLFEQNKFLGLQPIITTQKQRRVKLKSNTEKSSERYKRFNHENLQDIKNQLNKIQSIEQQTKNNNNQNQQQQINLQQKFPFKQFSTRILKFPPQGSSNFDTPKINVEVLQQINKYQQIQHTGSLKTDQNLFQYPSQQSLESYKNQSQQQIKTSDSLNFINDSQNKQRFSQKIQQIQKQGSFFYSNSSQNSPFQKPSLDRNKFQSQQNNSHIYTQTGNTSPLQNSKPILDQSDIQKKMHKKSLTYLINSSQNLQNLPQIPDNDDYEKNNQNQNNSIIMNRSQPKLGQKTPISLINFNSHRSPENISLKSSFIQQNKNILNNKNQFENNNNKTNIHNNSSILQMDSSNYIQNNDNSQITNNNNPPTLQQALNELKNQKNHGQFNQNIIQKLNTQSRGLKSFSSMKSYPNKFQNIQKRQFQFD